MEGGPLNSARAHEATLRAAEVAGDACSAGSIGGSSSSTSTSSRHASHLQVGRTKLTMGLEWKVYWGFSFLALGSLAAFMIAGWPGKEDVCVDEEPKPRGNCWCEPVLGDIGDAGVRQPFNTFSNLYALLTGAVVARAIGRQFRRKKCQTPDPPCLDPEGGCLGVDSEPEDRGSRCAAAGQPATGSLRGQFELQSCSAVEMELAGRATASAMPLLQGEGAVSPSRPAPTRQPDSRSQPDCASGSGSGSQSGSEPGPGHTPSLKSDPSIPASEPQAGRPASTSPVPRSHRSPQDESAHKSVPESKLDVSASLYHGAVSHGASCKPWAGQAGPTSSLSMRRTGPSCDDANAAESNRPPTVSQVDASVKDGFQFRAAEVTSRQGNRFLSTRFYPLAFLCILMYLGYGSMWFHASITYWGGVMDNISMYTYTNFLLMYTILRITGRDALCVCGYLFLTVVFTVLYIVGVPAFYLILVEVSVYAGLEVYIAKWVPEARASKLGWKYYTIAWTMFAVAFICWQLSSSGSVGCVRSHYFQFHGLWHVFAGVSGVYLYFYWTQTGR